MIRTRSLQMFYVTVVATILGFAIDHKVFSPSTVSAAPEAAHGAYKVVIVDSPDISTPEQVEQRLNEMSAKGWELHSSFSIPNGTGGGFIFKKAS